MAPRGYQPKLLSSMITSLTEFLAGTGERRASISSCILVRVRKDKHSVENKQAKTALMAW